MACTRQLTTRIDPMISTILKEINTAPRLLAAYRLHLTMGGQFTTMHEGVIHLTDEALALYYEYKGVGGVGENSTAFHS